MLRNLINTLYLLIIFIKLDFRDYRNYFVEGSFIKKIYNVRYNFWLRDLKKYLQHFKKAK